LEKSLTVVAGVVVASTSLVTVVVVVSVATAIAIVASVVFASALESVASALGVRSWAMETSDALARRARGYFDTESGSGRFALLVELSSKLAIACRMWDLPSSYVQMLGDIVMV